LNNMLVFAVECSESMQQIGHRSSSR